MRAAAALAILFLAAPAAPRADSRALHRERYVLCGVFVGKTVSTPSAVERARKAAAARRWSEAAAAYVQAARVYAAVTSATEAELLADNRHILYVNAALAWLNHGSVEAARTVLLDAAQRDPEIAAQLRESAEKLPHPPRCVREPKREP